MAHIPKLLFTSESDHDGHNTHNADTSPIKGPSFHIIPPPWHLLNSLTDALAPRDLAFAAQPWSPSALLQGHKTVSILYHPAPTLQKVNLLNPRRQTTLGTSDMSSIIDGQIPPCSITNIWGDGEYLLITDSIILLSNNWSYLTASKMRQTSVTPQLRHPLVSYGTMLGRTSEPWITISSVLVVQ